MQRKRRSIIIIIIHYHWKRSKHGGDNIRFQYTRSLPDGSTAHMLCCGKCACNSRTCLYYVSVYIMIFHGRVVIVNSRRRILYGSFALPWTKEQKNKVITWNTRTIRIKTIYFHVKIVDSIQRNSSKNIRSIRTRRIYRRT